MKFSHLLNEFETSAISQLVSKLSTNMLKESQRNEKINFLELERYWCSHQNQLVDQTVVIFLRDFFADTRTKDGNNGTKITLLPLFNDGRDQ